MRTANHLLVLTLDEQQYALHLSAVERIVRAVAVTHLPQAPEIVLGVVNVHGQVIPVVDVRKRFRLPRRDIELSDRFIITHTARRPVIVVADTVVGVMTYTSQDVMPAETILPGAGYVEGVVRLADGLLFIHNLDTFLSLDEEQVLHEVLLSA
ncbi:MAG: purine-binding chemotaxis protein CheW [Deltaproteobacteria bacterium]|nr:purine-binding chemotaxis protein CheW [Deltaproteobacteria bacterium]